MRDRLQAERRLQAEPRITGSDSFAVIDNLNIERQVEVTVTP